jgi:hypothetical protein
MRWLLSCAVASLMLAPLPVIAKAVVAEGVSFSSEKPITVAVFRPDVQVGSLTAGGVEEPNAEWTASARVFMAESMKKSQAARSNKIIFVPEVQGADRAVLADYSALFRAVSGAVITHKMFPGNKLPTKKDRFDWTMGEGAAQLRALSGNADYGLFFVTHDAYGTAGRKAAQIFGAMLGVGIVPGVHIGYAGLVDLKSGHVVWFNTDIQMGGDVRDAEGADKRVGQLLRGFPGTGAEPAAVASAK